MVKFSSNVINSVLLCPFKKETSETKEMIVASVSVCLTLVTTLAVAFVLPFKLGRLTEFISDAL